MKLKAIQVAENEALSSSMHQRHGAVVMKNGKIIGVGHNKAKCKWPSIHAEMDAIKSSGDVTDGHVYVVRVSSCGEMRNSKPCNLCLNYMRRCGITKVYWSTNDCGVECCRVQDM